VDQKDTYERTDNFNVYGVFCFFAMRLRGSFFQWTDTGFVDSTQVEITEKYHVPMAHDFVFELYQPLLAISMRSKSETVRALAYEVVDIFAYLLQAE